MPNRHKLSMQSCMRLYFRQILPLIAIGEQLAYVPTCEPPDVDQAEDGALRHGEPVRNGQR